MESFAKPYIAVTAILVVNTMEVGGVKTFATGVKTFAVHIDGVWSFFFNCSSHDFLLELRLSPVDPRFFSEQFDMKKPF